MVEREYGRVVNISSDAARVGSSLEAVYAGAKAAQVAFGKTLAREVARRGVTVNSVCPGPTETPLLDGMLGAGEASAKMVEALRRAVPMRRLGPARGRRRRGGVPGLGGAPATSPARRCRSAAG